MSSSECLPYLEQAQQAEAALQRLRAHEARAGEFPAPAAEIHPAELPDGSQGSPRVRFDQAVALLAQSKQQAANARARLQRFDALTARLNATLKKRRSKRRWRLTWLVIFLGLVGYFSFVAWSKQRALRPRADAMQRRARETPAESPLPTKSPEAELLGASTPPAENERAFSTRLQLRDTPANPFESTTSASSAPRLPARSAGEAHPAASEPAPAKTEPAPAAAAPTTAPSKPADETPPAIPSLLAPGALYRGEVVVGKSKYDTVLLIDDVHSGHPTTAVIRVSYGAFRRFECRASREDGTGWVLSLKPLVNPHPAGPILHRDERGKLPAFLDSAFPGELRLTLANSGLEGHVGGSAATTYKLRFLRSIPVNAIHSGPGPDNRLIWTGVGNPECLNASVAELAAKGDYESAIGFLSILADDGDAGAMLQIGKLYLQWRRSPADRQSARTWLKRASDAGNAEAASLLTKTQH